MRYNFTINWQIYTLLCVLMNLSIFHAIIINTISSYLYIVQLASKFTIKCERSQEPHRIFKCSRVTFERWHEPRRAFASELLACARLLHECEILPSVCPCTYVTRTSALTNSANTCHETATCSRARIRLYCFNFFSGLLIKPSIHSKEFY